MKASELIVELEKIVLEQGDIEVRYAAYDTSYHISVVHLEKPSEKVQLPHIVIE